MAIIDKLKFDTDIYNTLKNVIHYGKNVGENWPVVYILNDAKEAYIGETHHANVRMSQHLTNPDRRNLTDMTLISASNFNKSVILDLESFLIKHMSADGKYWLQNGNSGLSDHDYYNRSKYESDFVKIWNELKRLGIVNHTINEIENSNLYKYSPYKSLGPDQLEAEQQILEALAKNMHNENGAAILVRGGAGTGKTILAIYLMKLFADINSKLDIDLVLDDYLDEAAEIHAASESLSSIKKIGIVFPQATLKSSVSDVFEGIKSLNKKMVYSTTEVVDDFVKTGEKFDLLIVDEAHRLKCRYKGLLSQYPKFDACSEAVGLNRDAGNELEWILRCSRNQIFFRDELQTVRPSDMDGEDFINILEKKSNLPIEVYLDTQWRCLGGNNYINYLKDIFSCTATKFRSFDNYEFKLYKDIDKMITAIKEKDRQYGLCRNAAGYAWKWKSKKDKKAYDIEIQEHKYRWNSTYDNWIATKKSIDEIGCIHTLQGYDLNYVGLIIGEDIKYDQKTGQIYADKKNYFDRQGKAGVSNDPKALKEYLINIYLTLMTRGIRGTYLYICDDALRNYFEKFIEIED